MPRPFFLIQNHSVAAWTVLIQWVGLCAALLATTLPAEEPLTVQFNLLQLPSSRQTLAAINTPAMATFENRPLGECLESLSDAYRVSIWIDRRVDRSRLVSIVGLGPKESQAGHTTLGRIRAVAKLGGADAGLIENIVYVGPADQIHAVQRAAVRLHDIIMTRRKENPNAAKVDLRTLAWGELATPTDLRKLIEEQWTVSVLTPLPHDLMHAGSLPGSTLATQLTLLHAGFGLQVDCANDSVFNGVPLEQESNWRAVYASKEVQSSRLTAARQDFPSATLQTRGSACTVTGPTGFHLQLLSVRLPIARNTEPKFSIPEFRAPLDRIIGDLGKHLSMEVNWSPDIPSSKKQAVMTFGVPKPKTPDEILRQIATDSGLRIQREQQTIYVYPGESP